MHIHDLLLEDFQLPKWFFHGTSTTRLDAIRRQGLVPQPQKDNPGLVATYLASDRPTAEVYTDLAMDRHGGDPVILMVSPQDLDFSALKPDDWDLQNYIDDLHNRKPGETYGFMTGMEFDERLAPYRHWSEVSWQLSLAVTQQIAYTKVIPASKLRIMKL